MIKSPSNALLLFAGLTHAGSKFQSVTVVGKRVIVEFSYIEFYDDAFSLMSY